MLSEEKSDSKIHPLFDDTFWKWHNYRQKGKKTDQQLPMARGDERE